MAGFTGIEWAPGQLRHALVSGTTEMLPPDAGTPAVSRSVHYGLFLAFEGIRFFVRRGAGGLEVVFVNLPRNLERFREGIRYNLDHPQHELVPTADRLVELFLGYLGHERLRPFVEAMARDGAQGYLRPFTVDDDQSIGVTFPADPVIRIVAARYTSYLGEPFHGVTIPWLVRAVGVNGTGRLKLGVNYLLSVKAVQAARQVRPDATTALFLDDHPERPARDRLITEWDTSCALVALRGGRVVRIPDSPLILPSVTVRGIAALLARDGVAVEERDMSYGELVDRALAGEVVTVASIGTAGILNRCTSLTLLGDDREELGVLRADPDADTYAALGRARAAYWDVYRGEVEPPEGMAVQVYPL